MAKTQTSVPEELAHHTIISGKFNGKDFKLVGGGTGRPYDGKLKSVLKAAGGPLHFPMHLLDIVAIFGYPTYSRYHPGTVELFKISPEGYQYERHIKFHDGGQMNTLHDITLQKDGLHGDFKVLNGECSNVPELEGIENIVETFIPDGPGRIKSRCVLAWRKKGGGLFTADCESEYRLKHDNVLPNLQFRVVEFTTNHTQEVLDQQENLDVFRSLRQLDLK